MGLGKEFGYKGVLDGETDTAKFIEDENVVSKIGGHAEVSSYNRRIKQSNIGVVS